MRKLISGLIMLLCMDSQAAFIKGGSITYACQGFKVYKVTVKVSRECSGPALGSYQMYAFNSGAKVALTASRTSIKDVSNTCTKVALPCSTANQPSAAGVEEHVYEATVDFSSNAYKTFWDNRAGNCQVYFSFEADGRDTMINTMTHGQFYIIAMLNLCVVDANTCNSTPVDNGISALKICCNQPIVYNPSFIDKTDRDSLVFDTLTPKTAANTTESHAPGYSQGIFASPYCPPNAGVKNCRALPNAKPPRGLYFDRNTGELVYTPTICDENAAVVIRVSEYRRINGKTELVGFCEKELGIFTVECNDNNPPYFTGLNKFNVCEGNKICFTIAVKDEPFLPKQTVLDTVEVNWDSGIAGGTFIVTHHTSNEKTAEFCWQTVKGDARPGPYTFSVTANDNFCPGRGISFRQFSIIVKAKAADRRVYTKSKKGKMVFEAFPTSDTANYNANNYTYKFIIRNSTNSGTPLFMTYNRKDSFRFDSAGTYIIEHEINNPPLNCPSIYTETIHITQEHILKTVDLKDMKLHITPNPGSGIFFFSSDDADLAGAEIKVYALDGKLVFESLLVNSRLDITSLSKGVYTVELKKDDWTVHKKIIKEE